MNGEVEFSTGIVKASEREALEMNSDDRSSEPAIIFVAFFQKRLAEREAIQRCFGDAHIRAVTQ